MVVERNKPKILNKCAANLFPRHLQQRNGLSIALHTGPIVLGVQHVSWVDPKTTLTNAIKHEKAKYLSYPSTTHSSPTKNTFNLSQHSI